jgi:RsiW-degrading membrane proteinase PrsW (M82 family)
VLFTVLVSLAMLVGAGVMCLVLVAANAPDALAIGVVLAALPVGPVIACFLWLDRYEPEPGRLLALAFGWGALVATAVALILQALDQYFLGTPDDASAAIVAPITEEAAKGLFILLLLWFRRNELDGILDGIVYAGMVGIGFAFTENILYLSSAYVGGDGQAGGIEGAITLFVVRGVFSPFAHPLFTAFTGIGIGIAVVSRTPAARVLAPLAGYLLAVAAHAAWNVSVFLGSGERFVLTYLFVMVPGFFLIVGFAIWARRREAILLTEALTDCARRGFIDPAEIPWLVRLPARREARRIAEAVGGREARLTMAEYQQQAIELGFLHSRFLRGTAPPDFAQRGQYFVDAMRGLRPAVVWPSTAGRNAATVAFPAGGGQ